MSKVIVIVGGVAGGMSCAARIRRLDEEATIVVYEKGGAVSFANCGMPYYVGGVIADRANMIVQSKETLRGRYNLEIHVRHEVTKILPDEKAVEVMNLESGETLRRSYDTLVLAPGAEPIRPPVPGIDNEKVLTLNSLDDMDKIKAKAAVSRRACVIGAGFIGLELTENLRHLGLVVTLVEMPDLILPPLDRELTAPLVQELQLNGVEVKLGVRAEKVDDYGVSLSDGTLVQADLVCLCAGVRPRSELARDAGLELADSGHIVVDEEMRTSNPAIFAAGAAVQVWDRATHVPTVLPLAGPANRQGRIAADVICGRKSTYPGVLGTSIVQVFNQQAASTGWSDKRLKRANIPYFSVYIHPMQHVQYYPNAVPVSIKGLFSPEGKLLGAQVVGPEEVCRTIDTIAMALASGLTAEDLEHSELAYAPQFGAAKSGINMLGFTANNVVKGDLKQIETESLTEDYFLLDVREPEEVICGTIPGATIIPLDQLRDRHDELPRDKTIVVFCAVGLRGYIAYRQLLIHGFDVISLNGGQRTWNWCRGQSAKAGPQCPPCSDSVPVKSSAPAGKTVTLDVCGMQCPGPIVQVKKLMDELSPGDTLEVTSTDVGFIADIPAWCKSTGNALLEARPDGSQYVASIVKGAVPAAATAPSATPASTPAVATPSAENSKTIICFSDDLDKVMATFVIANGAAAMASAVTIFFTFWGLNVLKKERPPRVKKGFLDRMFGMMMPKGPRKLKLSKMHMGGLGSGMMRYVMANKRVMPPEELVSAARAAGIRLVACSMSMDVMGIHQDELIDGIEIGGVGAYLGTAEQSNVNLFI